MSQESVTAAAEMLNRVFTPTAPVHEADLFSGRGPQLDQVIEAALQPGQHVIIYGERGVGKTSLANILSTRLTSEDEAMPLVSPRVNCSIDDTYDTIWRKLLREIQISCETKTIGFKPSARKTVLTAVETLPEHAAPDDVLRIVKTIGARSHLLLILDEFDRVTAAKVRGLMADTIKMLSDHSEHGTLVIVGVADTVNQLISDHQSIERALIQIRMPRMSFAELDQLVRTGLARLGMRMDPTVLSEIVLLSHGLPHYTHNLALLACRQALSEKRLEVTQQDLHLAVFRAVKTAQETRREQFDKAVRPPNPGQLFQRLLLACSLAKSDELGYFAAADVRRAWADVNRPDDLKGCGNLLNSLCQPVRASILEKSGTKNRYRYRFRNAMMKPYVALRGVQEKLVGERYFDARRHDPSGTLDVSTL